MSWGACAMQGWRSSMEDAHICQEVDLGKDGHGMLFGVFDGHGGQEVATYLQENFKSQFLIQYKKKNDLKQALT